MEVLPSRRCKLRSSSRIWIRSLKSRLDSGSSNMRMRGSSTSERAIATRCCCPPDSCTGNRAAIPGEIDKLQHAADPVGDLRFAEPAQAQPECDIVEHREMRKQRVILENEADVPAVRRLVVKPLAMQADRALGERLETGDAPQRRRLAAAARSEQREKFPLLHLERYRAGADLQIG